MRYPGRVIKEGERDRNIVRSLKVRLNEILAPGGDGSLRLDPDEPSYGPKMKRAVKLFQTRSVDREGRPLKQDGQVGSLTWAALFGDEAVVNRGTTDDPLLLAAIRVAAQEEAARVREVPVDSNRGPRVEMYQSSAGVAPGNAWCCAFVYFCMLQASQEVHLANPMVRTGGCLDHWNKAKARGVRLVNKGEAIANPALISPGMIFIMSHGGNFGHTGFVERTLGGLLTTIEGNTNAGGSREGGGVYRLTRKVAEVNKGFIDYARG